MRKLTIGGILVLAMSVFAVNVLASTPEGACPIWSQEELDRIGTLGGDLLDYEYYSGGCEYCYDLEAGAAFMHQALIYKSGDYFLGRYHSTNSTADDNNVYRWKVLTEDEYNRCKQMLIDHKTKQSSVRPSSAGPPYQNRQEELNRKMQNTQYQGPRGRKRKEVRDWLGGLPPEILALQSNEEVQMPTIDDAVKIALAAAEEAALPLIDTKFHNNGKTITVPDDYKSIQAAINAAGSGDVVLVKPGTYYELLVMKDGVKVVSDSADGGDELVPVEGAMLKLPRRALRTIIDGSGSETSCLILIRALGERPSSTASRSRISLPRITISPVTPMP
jgi:hypothetical protein